MEKKNERWQNRRTRMASKTKGGVRDAPSTIALDTTDGPRNIVDPLNRGTSRQTSRMSAMSGMSGPMGPQRKKSVLQMTMDGIQSLSVSNCLETATFTSFYAIET